MMVTKKFKMCGLKLSGTVTFKAVLLFGFVFLLWHECTGMNRCTGGNNFSIPQSGDITLTCNISDGSGMFWWLYLDETKMVGYCSFNKNLTCNIEDNTTNYTLTSSQPLFSELTISENNLSKLAVRCNGPFNTTIRDYEEKQNCSIHVVYPPDPPYFKPSQDGLITVNDTQASKSTLYCYARGGRPSFQKYQTDLLEVSCEGIEKEFGFWNRGQNLSDFSGNFSGHNGTVCTCLETTSTDGHSFNRTATVTVLVENQAPETTTTTIASATTRYVSPKAASSSTSSPGLPATVSSGPVQEGDNGENDNADSSPPVIIIAVCTVVLVLFIVIIVIIIIVVRRRRDAQKRNNQTIDKEVDVVVEHINDMYVAAEDFHDPPHPNPSPSDAARTPSNQKTAASSLLPPPAAAAALSIDEEVSSGYSSVSMIQPAPPSSLVSPLCYQGNATGLHSTADGDDGRLVLEASGTQAGGEYAVVKKPRPTSRKSDQPGDVYAQVQKKSKRNVAFQRGDTEADSGDSGMSSASAKPILTVKPEKRGGAAMKNASSSDQDRSPLEVTSASEDDDNYKALNFHRSPARESNTDPEGIYSHLAGSAGNT